MCYTVFTIRQRLDVRGSLSSSIASPGDRGTMRRRAFDDLLAYVEKLLWIGVDDIKPSTSRAVQLSALRTLSADAFCSIVSSLEAEQTHVD